MSCTAWMTILVENIEGRMFDKELLAVLQTTWEHNDGCITRLNWLQIDCSHLLLSCRWDYLSRISAGVRHRQDRGSQGSHHFRAACATSGWSHRNWRHLGSWNQACEPCKPSHKNSPFHAIVMASFQSFCDEFSTCSWHLCPLCI